MANISELKFDHKNARKRTDSSSRLIQESLQRYGAARSIVIDEDNRILAGNGTIEGAKAAGIKNVRIIETDGNEVIAVRRTGLTEDQKIGLALADNRTSDLSEWDQEMLRRLSEEHDISPWFNDEDLNELLAVTELPPEEGKTDPDDVPEAPEQPITKPGDLWILGNHRLLCGDSTNIQHVERLMDGQKADMVFTDPPYGIAYKSPSGAGMTKRGDYAVIKGDTEPYDPSPLFGLCDLVVAWGANHYADKLPPSRAWLVWDKREGDAINNNSDCELAWVSQGGSARLFHHKWNGMIKASEKNEKRVHPTQKPVALAEWTFELLDAGTTIVDFYGGSGSTLIACEKTSRHCRMMELDPAYCDVIVKRWEDFTGNTAVCIPSDAHFTQELQEAA
jgi:DNA modification methylase